MAYYFHKTHCVFPEHERYHRIKTKRHAELLEERKVMQKLEQLAVGDDVTYYPLSADSPFTAVVATYPGKTVGIIPKNWDMAPAGLRHCEECYGYINVEVDRVRKDPVQAPKPEGKTVKIITDDGYEIEAQVTSKKKVDTAEPDYCVGDYILIDGIARAIQKVGHDTVTTGYGYQYKKRAIRASEAEAKLPIKFSEEELKMRDQIAAMLIEKLCMDWHKTGDPTNVDGKASASADVAYRQAEAMVISRRSPQYKHKSWKKDGE
jgi:hypothetical protein